MRRLQQIPSVGPLIAHALVIAIGDPRRFATARDCAAWIGLTAAHQQQCREDPHRPYQSPGRSQSATIAGARRRQSDAPGQSQAEPGRSLAARHHRAQALQGRNRRAGSQDRTHRLGPAVLGRQLSGRGGASLMPVPRRLTYPDTDCACAVACGVKPEPPLAVAARGLTPHATAKPRSYRIWPGQQSSVPAHSGRTSRPYRARSKPQRRQFGQDLNQDTPFCHRASARRNARNPVRVTHRGQRSFQTAQTGRIHERSRPIRLLPLLLLA